MSGIPFQPRADGMHVRSIQPQAGGGNHLRAERARGCAGKTAISRMLDPMDDGGLSVVSVNGSLAGIDLSRARRAGPESSWRCDARGQLRLFVGRLARVRYVARGSQVKGSVRTQGQVPGRVSVIAVESGEGS